MEWIKRLISLMGALKMLGVVAVAFTALVGPKTFNDVPSTMVVGTVARIEAPMGARESDAQLVVGQKLYLMNLSISLKCLAPRDQQCSERLVKFRFPALGLPEIHMADDVKMSVKGPKKLGRDDNQGRGRYEIELFRPLTGGNLVRIDMPINGRVVYADFNLLDIRGRELVDTDFDCRNNGVDGMDHISQAVCEERFGVWDRFLLALPFLG